jgi:GntR family transcriptional regulator, transcriptional repressor for pyruvate dehydrogenase complex
MTQNGAEGEKRQLRRPRLADIIAGSLRDRIISGELADGSSLPTLEKMVQEFGVSSPSVREALRILETEGLVSVRRGNVGGAVVHLPKPLSAAHMIGIILQSQKVSVADLESALTSLEPLCAGLCAARRDRMDTVVPDLQAIHQQAKDGIEDPLVFGRAMRRFHRLLAKRCGNNTLILMVTALESLWANQRDTWSYRLQYTNEAPQDSVRDLGLRDHGAILDAIIDGQVEVAERLVRDHAVAPDVYASTDNRIIRMMDIFPGTGGIDGSSRNPEPKAAADQ